MLGMLFRLTVVGALLGGGAYLYGNHWDDSTVQRVRAAGADAAEVAQSRAGDVALTAKVKGKIALDDTLDGTGINVDTEGAVVTLRGSVANTRQRQRALQLARETEGVRSVVDRIDVTRR